MQRLLITALLGTLFAARWAHGEGLLVVPAELDLGEWATGGTVPGIVWLINDTPNPVRLSGADVPEHVELHGFVPATIPPSGAMEVSLTLRADEREEHVRERVVRFHAHPRRPTELTVRVRSLHPDVHLPPPTSYDNVGARLRLAPPRLHFGIAAPGQKRTKTAWLVNDSDAPLTIETAKGSCSCLTVPEMPPTAIAPRRAMPVELTMLAEGHPGQTRHKHATFIVEGDVPVTLPVLIDVVDPLLGRLLRYLEAYEQLDAGAVRANLSLDSTIVLGSAADAPVVRRDADGYAPWHAWQGALRLQRRHQDYRVDGRTITAMRHDLDDIDRLLGRAGHWTPVEFTYNEVGELASTRIIEARRLLEGGRADAFVAWASRHRGPELAALRSVQLSERTADHARRWRTLLAAWHRSVDVPARRIR